MALAIPPGSLQRVNTFKDYVFYVTLPVRGHSAPLPGGSLAIHIFDLEGRKDSILIAQAENCARSFDEEKRTGISLPTSLRNMGLALSSARAPGAAYAASAASYP